MFALTTLLSLSFSLPLIVSGLSVKVSGCDLSKASMPTLPSPLAAPTTKLSYVAVAIGTQNYTCASTGTYTNVGAVAELYDISCLYSTPAFSKIQDIAITAWKAAPPKMTTQQVIKLGNFIPSSLVLGQHYYVTNPVTGQGINPKWDFTSSGVLAKKSAQAYVVAAKVNGTAAPTGKQDIDWVQLKSLTGSLGQQVYRTDTRLGQPPANCTAGSPDIQIKYAAKYWLYGSTL